MTTTRQFVAEDAERKNVPLLLGLTAPSGGGKTWSAILLALGIQEVSGGDIYVIDSDNNRALHYAGMQTAGGKTIRFKHISFSAPHDSLSYREAIRYCEAQKAGVIIVDTLSKEHDGEGGMLEWHDAELDLMAGTDYRKRESMSMLAWAKPKAARRKLIQTIQELDTHTIFTFRAKQGVKPIKVNGKTEVVQQGFTPIAGDEFVFEMTLNALLLPNSKGVATWDAEHVGERQMIKLPEQFAGLRTRTSPLDEKLGRHLAEWARGGKPAAPKADKPASASKPEIITDEHEGPEELHQERPTETASAPSAEAEQGSSDSATPASTDLPAEVSGPTADQHPSSETPEIIQEGNAALAATGAANVTEEPSTAFPAAFQTFAGTVAGATDWPTIKDALGVLTKSPDWLAGTDQARHVARVIAYTRLVELNEGGYRFDFINDLHAYRCFIEACDDLDALKGTRRVIGAMKMFLDLPTKTKITFDRAHDERAAVLSAKAAGAEFA